MYDKIMSLPLLRGAGEESLLAFLEKTSLDFATFEPGETIVAMHDTCRSLRCVISGAAEIVHPLFDGRFRVAEKVSDGCFLGVERLFGLDNSLNFKVSAVTRCGIMTLSKAQYLDLLRSDNIFLLNCLNYISRSVQRYEDLLQGYRGSSVKQLLAGIVDVVTTRRSHGITIETADGSLEQFLRTISGSDLTGLKELADTGLVEILSDSALRVPDRNALVDSAFTPES